MGFTGAIKTCFRKYADFRGRAPRSEYWYFVLFEMLLLGSCFVLARVFDAIRGDEVAGPAFGILAVVALLGFILPGLAVTVRRLHDTNNSGWWYLLALFPYVGGLILFGWCCVKGTYGVNRFGPDPLNPDLAEAFD